jgi:hypothetical protein
MSGESLSMAGTLLVILPTVIFGGVSILTLLIRDPRYRQNPLRQQLWRAKHAHAGVLLILSLLTLLYVDQAVLSDGWKAFVRLAIPTSAILLPAAYFLSVLHPDATRPNALINLPYVGTLVLTSGLIVLGVGLLQL